MLNQNQHIDTPLLASNYVKYKPLVAKRVCTASMTFCIYSKDMQRAEYTPYSLT